MISLYLKGDWHRQQLVAVPTFVAPHRGQAMGAAVVGGGTPQLGEVEGGGAYCGGGAPQGAPPGEGAAGVVLCTELVSSPMVNGSTLVRE